MKPHSRSDRPICVVCEKDMVLVKSKPNPARPSFETQTYECADCGATRQIVVEH